MKYNAVINCLKWRDWKREIESGREIKWSHKQKVTACACGTENRSNIKSKKAIQAK